MLKTPTPFPQPGSYAKLAGHRGTVRIQQHNADGTYLVTSATLTGRHVTLDQLKAAPARPQLLHERLAEIERAATERAAVTA